MMQMTLDLEVNRTYTKREKPLKVLELFGGIGAPRQALQNIDIKVKSIDYVEVLANAVKAYNAMYDNNYTAQDIKTWNMNVDLLVHGSPCVDFSNAGKNDITSGRSILYQRTIEIIEKELHPRPKYVLWENVPGLLTKKHHKHFQHYLFTLEKLGYTNHWKVLNSLDFGLPQHRPRVFVMSIRNDIVNNFSFDELEHRPRKNVIEFLEDIDDGKYDVKQPSMIQALKNNKVQIIVKYAGTITTKQIRWNTRVLFKDNSFYQRNFDKIPASKSKHGYSLDEAKQYFPDMFKGKKLEEVFRYLTPRECWNLQGFKSEKTFKEFGNFYTLPRSSDGKLINGSYNRAWKVDKYVGTIPANVKIKIAYEVNGEVNYRELTAQESWLLQGFDLEAFDRVKATGISETDLYMLAGNSIPVTVLEAIFKELLLRKD